MTTKDERTRARREASDALRTVINALALDAAERRSRCEGLLLDLLAR